MTRLLILGVAAFGFATSVAAQLGQLVSAMRAESLTFGGERGCSGNILDTLRRFSEKVTHDFRFTCLRAITERDVKHPCINALQHLNPFLKWSFNRKVKLKMHVV